MVAKTLGYDITNMTLIAFAGIVIKLFLGGNYSSDGTSGPAGAAIWGYGLVAISVLAIMFISYGLSSQMANVQEMNTMTFVKSLLMHSLPPMLLLGVLIWIIYLNASYYTRINQDKVASEYYNYSTVSTVLIVIQLLVLFKYLVDEMKIGEGGPTSIDVQAEALRSKLASVTYLISLANFSLAGIMNIILKYFSTDG